MSVLQITCTLLQDFHFFFHLLPYRCSSKLWLNLQRGCRWDPVAFAGEFIFLSFQEKNLTPSLELRRYIIFFHFLSRFFCFLTSKYIHTMKWKKAPYSLAYGRKWYAAYRAEGWGSKSTRHIIQGFTYRSDFWKIRNKERCYRYWNFNTLGCWVIFNTTE